MATSATDAMSILDFSWPEVMDSPFNKNPSTYAEILKQLIKLFIKFMIEYVQTNNPVDVQLVEAFLKRMAYIWGNFSDDVLGAAPGWYGPGFDPVWNTERMPMAVSVSSEEKMNEAKANRSFYDFSRKFYEIFDDFKYKGETVYFHAYSFVDVSCPVTRLINESPSSNSFKWSMCLSRCRNKKFTMADMGSCLSLIAA